MRRKLFSNIKDSRFVCLRISKIKDSYILLKQKNRHVSFLVSSVAPAYPGYVHLESQRFKRFVGIKSRPASNLKDSLESTRTSCQIINGDIQKPRYLYLYTVKSESILDGSPLAIRRKGGVEDFKRTILRDEQQAAPVCSCSVQSSKTQDAEDSRLHDRIAALQ